MARLLRFAALSSLAILALLYLPSQATAASIEHLGARAFEPIRGHDNIAKRKRSDTGTPLQRRCKPKSTSTKKPSSTPAVSSNGGGGNNPSDHPLSGAVGKVGFAYGGDDQHLHYWKTPLTKHIYNWAASPPSTAKSLGFDYCPMAWSYKNIDQFVSLTSHGNYTCALGPNEANEVGQANMNPGDALKLWNTYVRPLKNKGYKLCTPSMSSRPNGFGWMHQFFDLCGGDNYCDADMLCIHWYDNTIEKFMDFVNRWHREFPGIDIWVTEYACQNMNDRNDQCSESYTWQFHQTVAGWMNKQSWITAYMAFGVLTDMDGVNPDNQMMDPTTQQPNALGTWYIHQ